MSAQTGIAVGQQGTVEELGRSVPGLSGRVGPRGTGICVAYRLDSPCDYIVAFGRAEAGTVIVLLEVQSRPDGADALFEIVDVVNVPDEFADKLTAHDCRYDGYAHGQADVEPFVAAIDVAGEPG
ncbi:MAG: hypothetical protein R3305_04935, partial [Gammaproteobacteria bacterium]|nr:hypothetical protein [Gammaproteobacteria bacterium]